MENIREKLGVSKVQISNNAKKLLGVKSNTAASSGQSGQSGAGSKTGSGESTTVSMASSVASTASGVESMASSKSMVSSVSIMETTVERSFIESTVESTVEDSPPSVVKSPSSKFSRRKVNPIGDLSGEKPPIAPSLSNQIIPEEA